MKQLLQVLIFLFLPLIPRAQPANDECSGAIELTNIVNWCSASRTYTNVGATPSAQMSPNCFGEIGSDIWFTFSSISTSVNLRVLGDIVDIYGITDFSQGTMTGPKLALYSGSCDDLTLIGCDEDTGDQIAELYSDMIIPNGTYYLRVSSPASSSGSFQLCLSSFNLVPDPVSDCPTGVVLCDKSSFFVPSIQGSGEIPNEVNTSCLSMEDNSAWYKWVAGSSGSLGFTITPNNPGDDIDFAVLELPNGLNDCSGMIEVRCMASGANGTGLGFPFIPAPFNEWDECTGPTGLTSNETDISETAGCITGSDNNFISAFNMVEGTAYALVILNFSATGHGFSLEFDGTGEFLGPIADFVTDDLDGTICFGESVTFFDQSSFGNLQLMEWQWNFGESAVPQTMSGSGPHQVRYTSGGVKSIALTVEGETGCLVTEIGSIIVEDPFEVVADITDQSCPESEDGRIAIDITSGSNITSIQWDNGLTERIIDRLDPGNYEVTIVNFNGCDTVIPYRVESPEPLEIEELIVRPTCGGGDDGSITLNVDGQAPPFLFNFGVGFTTNNTITDRAADIYNIQVQDNNGCITDLRVALGEIDIELDPNFDPIQPPTCFGFSNGRAEIRIIGGEPPFAYDWRINGTYRPDNFLDGLSAGPINVAIRENLSNCLGFAQFLIPEPEELLVNIDTLDISCFGAVDGTLTPIVFGGTGNYSYNWSFGGTDSVAQGLDQGQYQLTVQDANGCQSQAFAHVTEPPELAIQIDSTRDAICFGDATGAIYFDGIGGSPPFTYSLDSSNFTEELSFEGISAGLYTVTIRDDRGCTNTLETEIFQPRQLMVDAGRDTTIDLGFSAQLLAINTPIGKPVIYSWNPEGDCSDCPFLVVRPSQTTSYVVTIVDEDNCMARDSVDVNVVGNRPIYVPNSFTPNSDGFNDRVIIYGGPAAQSIRRMQIFDRWGEMVYEGNDMNFGDENIGWDGIHRGQPMNPAVFVYVAEVEFIDGQVLQFEGDITLLR